MKKNLVIFEVNECDFSYFFYGAKKYNFPNIKKFFLNKKKNFTYTRDKTEGLNLDPWVQWVSVHTGFSSAKHKVFRIGQKLNKSINQFWDILIKKNITVSLWGLFNSNLRSKKNIDLFFPDPWSFSQEAYPREINSYLKLPRYYAKNYPNVNKIKLIFFGIIFIKKIFFSNILFYLIRNFFILFYIFFKVGLKSYNLYFFLDLISLHIVKNRLKYKKSDTAIIALNCFAHYQHNFWDEKDSEFFYFWYLNEIIKQFQIIENKYNSSIIYNGFSQKKIPSEYALRPKNINQFLKILNIKYLRVELNMTTGATLFFENNLKKNNAIKIFRKITLCNRSLFEIVDYKKKKKIFCKFNFIFKKKLTNIDFISIKNFDKYIKTMKKISSKIKDNQHNREIVNQIIENSMYIKSTSHHIRDGIMYSYNFNVKKTNKSNMKIHNQTINDLIIKHFS